jgi:Zn finger protein HypA/HybF involved in hydrogenase expression
VSFNIEINNDECKCDQCSFYFDNHDKIYCESCYDGLVEENEQLSSVIEELESRISFLMNVNELQGKLENK